MTFGIPTKVLPVTAQEEADWQHHYDWISSRKSIEAKNLEVLKEEQTIPSDESNKDGLIYVPRTMDVLTGKGSLPHLHTGNSCYQFIIDENRARYDACETSTAKTILASAIVMTVKENGGRFLIRKRGETYWSEANEWVAREKVTNAFRGRRKSAAKRFKRITDGADTYKRRLPEVAQPHIQQVTNLDLSGC